MNRDERSQSSLRASSSVERLKVKGAVGSFDGSKRGVTMRTRRVGPGRRSRGVVVGATTAVALTVGAAAVGIPPVQVAADGSVDLLLEKSGPATIAANQTVTYRLTVRVNGAGVLTGWAARDDLPSVLTPLSAVISNGICAPGGGEHFPCGFVEPCSIEGQTVTCVDGASTFSTARIITVTAVAAADVEPGCVVNTAMVVGTEPDPNLDNNTDTVRTQACDADPMGHIEVTAGVINDHGGTAIQSDFSVNVDGSPVADETIVDVTPGTHTMTHTPFAGYSFAGFSGDCAPSGTITIAAGETVHCTAVYDDQPATITIEVLATPVTSALFEFASSPPLPTGLAVTPGSPVTVGGLPAGTYTFVEQTEPGWMLTAVGGGSVPGECRTVGGNGSIGIGDLSTRSATIELHNGDTVHCVFENTQLLTTRTQGFWATHPQLAQVAWFGAR